MKRQRWWSAIAGACALASGLYGEAHAAKNVIYLISDGAGFNTYKATNFYNGSNTIQEGAGWNSFAMSTYPLRTGTAPIAGAAGLAQDPNTVYSSANAWDTDPNPGSPPSTLEFDGYNWQNSTAPDSANTISSTMTGVKTYNNAVNVNGNGTPVAAFAELAHTNYGMRTGIVTTVQWSDATPSAMSGVHNVARANHGEISNAMLSAPYIDVIMGAGNPDYDNDGVLRATPIYAGDTGPTPAGWVTSTTWNDLKDNNASGQSASWQLIQEKSDFEALANGTLAGTNGRKIVGTVKSYDGKQQYRGGLPADYVTEPFATPLKGDVPTLTTMVQGALNVLPDSGFFLGIEQGEVDRAMHSNNVGRMIEAQTEFNDTVAYIDTLLTSNAGNPNLPNYANTLVIVTADHDHQLYGADSNTNPFSSPSNNGAGNMPGALFQTGSHSNHLVPIFAKGSGANLLAGYADQTDAFTDGQNRTFGQGRYLDQGELYSVFTTALAVPEPSTFALLAISSLPSLGFRRRRLAVARR